MDSLWVALAMLLIIEGILPFLAPRLWRDTFRRITELSDGQLRFVGLISIAARPRLAPPPDMRKWLLPEAIEDVLPVEAARVEALRRVLLDHFRGRGFRLVQPPLLEFLDSLLTGTGRDLDLLTFKMVDPLSGRMLGLRADTTPQVARIDAHLLNEPGVTRLCYAGSVLRTASAGRATRDRSCRSAPSCTDTPASPPTARSCSCSLRARPGRRARPASRPLATSASIGRWRVPPVSTAAARATMPTSSRRCATRTPRQCTS